MTDYGSLQGSNSECGSFDNQILGPVPSSFDCSHYVQQRELTILEGDFSGASAFAASSTARRCACIVCLGLGDESLDYAATDELRMMCRFPMCNWSSPDTFTVGKMIKWMRQHHEKRHCARVTDPHHEPVRPNFFPGTLLHFHCIELNCTFTTKRWSDLERHTVTKHCTNKRRYPCSVIECKYHGEGKGFIRKDKLQSHFRAVHEGKARPGRANRVVKPKIATH